MPGVLAAWSYECILGGVAAMDWAHLGTSEGLGRGLTTLPPCRKDPWQEAPRLVSHTHFLQKALRSTQLWKKKLLGWKVPVPSAFTTILVKF